MPVGGPLELAGELAAAAQVHLGAQASVPKPAGQAGEVGDVPSDGHGHAHHFTGAREHRRLPGVGHAVPQEAPSAFAAAVMALVQGAAT